MSCPCGSGIERAECCEPYVRGEKTAPTAEALMRSRYVAYTMEATDYIVATHDAATRDDVDREAADAWSKQADWRGLEIIETEKGGASDDEGIVEFAATYAVEGVEHRHHERSRFHKVDGQWFYVDGDMMKPKPVKREVPKVGRNEPCPCGSGKKYKRCCG